jgi:hypothetical protein
MTSSFQWFYLGGGGVFNNTLSMEVYTAQTCKFTDGLGRIWKEGFMEISRSYPRTCQGGLSGITKGLVKTVGVSGEIQLAYPFQLTIQ